MLEFSYSQIFLLVFVLITIIYYIISYGRVEGKHEKKITEKYGRTPIGKVTGPIFSLLMLMWIILSIIYFFSFESSNWFYKIVFLDSDIIKIAAIIIMSFALFLSILFVRSVGNSIKEAINLQKKPQLITSGIYHYIRHPVYMAIILGIFGTFLIIPNLLMLIFSLFTTIIMHLHSREEEKTLIKMFGSEYEEYMKRTGRFFPKIK